MSTMSSAFLKTRSDIARLRPRPLRVTRFILDVHLGKLAKSLRLLGFDTAYENNFSDQTIVTRSTKEKRIILARDVGLLKHKKITHRYWIRATNPKKQMLDVLNRFDLRQQCRPFIRCIECNGLLKKIAKNKIATLLPPRTQKYYHTFVQCQHCQKVYWQGSHYQKLKKWVGTIAYHFGTY